MKMTNGDIYKESIEKLLKETDNIVFKIRTLNFKNEGLTAQNDKDIVLLHEKLIETEAMIKKTLIESGEDNIKPKCGWAHFSTLKDIIVIKDAEKTIEEIKVKLPSFVEHLIKYEEAYSIRKDKLNQLVKDQLIRIEVLETVTVEAQDKKFAYKYTGGNK